LALTYYDALLKDVFLPSIRRAELEYGVFSARIKRSTKRILGDYVVWPVMYQGEQGLGAVTLRGGAWPTQVPGEFYQGKALLKANLMSLMIYGVDYEVLSSGTPNEQVASQIATKVDSAKREFATDINRQYWQTSAGYLATVTATATSTVHEVDSTKYFRLGQRIYCTTDATSSYVADINATNKTITTDDSIAMTVGHYITRYGANTFELTGIPGLIGNSGTVQNLDKDTYSLLQSYVKQASAPLSFTIIDDAISEVIYTKGGRPSILYGCKDTANWLQYLYKKLGAYPNTMNIQLGYQAISYTTPFGTIPFVVEPHAPDHYFWILDETNLWLRNTKEFDFRKGTDGYWFHDATYDYLVAHGYWYAELVHETPWQCGYIYDYTTPVV